MKIEYDRDGFGHLVHDDNDRDALVSELNLRYDDAVMAIREGVPALDVSIDTAWLVSGTCPLPEDSTWVTVSETQHEGYQVSIRVRDSGGAS